MDVRTDQKCSGCGAPEQSCMERPEPCCDLCMASAMFTHDCHDGEVS